MHRNQIRPIMSQGHLLLYTAMHKTLLLSSKGSRLRKHMGTRQKLSLSRLALAMSAVRSAAELPRGAEAFAPRPESFLLSVHRTTVAAAGGTHTAAKKARAL